MLAAIRQFIQEQKIVTETQLLRQFNIELSVLEPMLAILEQRQEIAKMKQDVCQKQCQDCESPNYYNWIGS